MATTNGFGLNGLSQTSTPERNTGSVAEPDSEIFALYRRHEQFQVADVQKNGFFHELLMKIEMLQQQRDTAVAQQQRDVDYVQAWQAEKSQYEQCFKQLQRSMGEHQFVLLLIDGDGMVFTDEFIRQGEVGGRQVASQLYSAVEHYIGNDLPLGFRIVCRMYASVRGLGDVLVRTGVIQEINVFEDFVRGFTRGKALFDFVDVGAGKDRADKKIIESFKMFSRDIHCARLLFGCSHDNGYARTLEECLDRPDIVGKTVLLEGVPFEKELLPLPYATKKFDGLFRESKIVVPGAFNPLNYKLAKTTPEAPSPMLKNYNMLSGMPSRFPPPVRTLGVLDSPLPSRAALAMTSTLPRTPSSSTIASDGFQAAIKPSVGISWASKAAAPPAQPTETESIQLPPIPRHEQIARNRAGQRIDPPCKNYDKTEVDRIKKIKLCNVHFLRDECPYDTGCTHLHAYKPTKDELQTLRLVARMALCTNGSGCQDIKCIYGHRCPAPTSHKLHGVARSGKAKTCIFAESCKFPADLHDIDSNVVKTLVIR